MSTFGNSYLFAGRRFDDETGLYYYRNRYYEAKTGRFVSRDPLGYADGKNLYLFVQDNPINFIDPYGFFKEGRFAKDEAAGKKDGYHYSYVLSGDSGEVLIQEVKLNVEVTCGEETLCKVELGYHEAWILTNTSAEGYDNHFVNLNYILKRYCKKEVCIHACGEPVAKVKQAFTLFSGGSIFRGGKKITAVTIRRSKNFDTSKVYFSYLSEYSGTGPSVKITRNGNEDNLTSKALTKELKKFNVKTGNARGQGGRKVASITHAFEATVNRRKCQAYRKNIPRKENYQKVK